ncbi:post-transcriptional regulator [Paenibacillus senegalensis]|uniref:post-transcriptional regulator n=1 Tax=Paenibacillus senegalensis TaxID=1465766 RepID=UPI00028975B3|nr:post-transcriptional regulator [Paenibacillus senegalensis]
MSDSSKSKREQLPMTSEGTAIDPELSRQLQEAKSILDDIQQQAGETEGAAEQKQTYSREKDQISWKEQAPTREHSLETTPIAEQGHANLEWIEAAERLCIMKAEEFAMLGYTHVTADEIWECVRSRYRKTGPPALHQLVNDILTLKVPDFMNWMTMQAYKGASL